MQYLILSLAAAHTSSTFTLCPAADAALQLMCRAVVAVPHVWTVMVLVMKTMSPLLTLRNDPSAWCFAVAAGGVRLLSCS